LQQGSWFQHSSLPSLLSSPKHHCSSSCSRWWRQDLVADQDRGCPKVLPVQSLSRENDIVRSQTAQLSWSLALRTVTIT
jgi:hypothetical protein